MTPTGLCVEFLLKRVAIFGSLVQRELPRKRVRDCQRFTIPPPPPPRLRRAELGTSLYTREAFCECEQHGNTAPTGLCVVFKKEKCEQCGFRIVRTKKIGSKGFVRGCGGTLYQKCSPAKPSSLLPSLNTWRCRGTSRCFRGRTRSRTRGARSLCPRDSPRQGRARCWRCSRSRPCAWWKDRIR